MDLFMQGLANVLEWQMLLILIVGAALGIAIGSLPGLTATMGVALLVPVTYGMDPAAGILLLVSLYFGAIYGGSITAILLRTPGTPAAAATALDGYEMTKRGLGQKGLLVAVYSSATGAVVSVTILIFLSPVLANFALNFSAPETFALALFGLSIISSVAGESMLKGLIAGVAGLLVATIGLDPMDGFARFTFDNVQLLNGVDFIPVMIGLFAAAQAFKMMEDIFSKEQINLTIEKSKLKWKEFKSLIITMLRSSAIGTGIGMIPGAGGDISAFVAYNEAKRFSKKPEEFGKGAMEGVAAPESANTGTSGGSMIPLLTLGIPGDAVTAVMLGSLMVAGLQPGPLLFVENADVVYTIFVGMIVATILILIYGLIGIRHFVKILLIPKPIMATFILVLCVVGSYSIGNNFFDVWVMFVAGVIGYFMIRYGYPASPVILALILGPLMESNLRRSLVMSGGSYDVFFTRPITAILLSLAVLTLFSPLIRAWYVKRRVNGDNNKDMNA
ncbi:tripartite tricarboxylate transporter permease [Salicibibacter cibi]|nr:tripartite tricarboxylate transporter permease [Salicibibacter cibi]